MLVNTVGDSAARATVGVEVVAGARVFERLLEQDTQRLVQGARLMSADYAFREVIATGDHDTIASALTNYSKRIDAPLVMVVDLDGDVLGDTLEQSTGARFDLPKLLAEAETSGQASAMVVLHGSLYQLAVVPVLAPVPIAWVVIGQRIDDALTRAQQRLTRLDVSFLSRQGKEGWKLQASTLADDDRRDARRRHDGSALRRHGRERQRASTATTRSRARSRCRRRRMRAWWPCCRSR